jgi:DNA polymerase-3 subunit alpha
MGDIGQAIDNGNLALAEACARRWAEIFPVRSTSNCSVPASQHGCTGAPERGAGRQAGPAWWPRIRCSSEPDEFIAHEAAPASPKARCWPMRAGARFNEQQYFKTQAEMAELFADLPARLPTPWKSPSAAT